MYRSIPLLLLCTAAMAQSASSGIPTSQSSRPQTPPASQTDTQVALPPAVAERASSKLPPPPKGKSTVVGGQISSVDPVRDQIRLKVFGGKSIIIRFDERTLVFRDGVRKPLLSLRSNERASVETILDGTSVFALRIHMLSHVEDGECRGQIVRYNPSTGDLALEIGLAREPLTLRVTGLTIVEHVGQSAQPGVKPSLSDLVPGAIVFAKFAPGGDGLGLATHVQIIATPGSTFVFSGNITFLDLRAGKMVVADSHFQDPREIIFDVERFPNSRELHEGSSVEVTTTFDGKRFAASQMVAK